MLFSLHLNTIPKNCSGQAVREQKEKNLREHINVLLRTFYVSIFKLGNQNGDCFSTNIIKKSMTTIRESDKIYHGCFNKNKDGTNKLIKKGEKCLTLTHFPFWKCPLDVPNGLMTGAQEKKQKKITTDKFIKYFQNIENIQWWLTADDLEIEILNEDDRLYIVE